MAITLQEYFTELQNSKDLLKEEATQDTKVLERLNTIRNQLSAVKNITKEQAKLIDSKMNAYWKQISASKVLNLETKKNCGSLIQTIKTMAQSKSN